MKSIAIFDSGIGGITFLRDARRALPLEHFIYFADTDHVPYGTKPEADVRRYVEEAVAFLASQGIKALVIACNAATSAAVAELRKKYSFPILGMEPAVKPALEYAEHRKVLVFSTSLTARGYKLQLLISRLRREAQIVTMPFDELVCTAEAFDFNSPHVRRIIREKLETVDLDEFGALVLGCTHFIFYRSLIEEALPSRVQVFDGNIGTLRNLMKTLDGQIGQHDSGAGQVTFFASGRVPDAEVREKLQRLTLSS